MKTPKFGQALPEHLREPQRFATCDPWPNVPLVIHESEPLPTIGEAITWLGSFVAISVFCFFSLGA